jgi:hypothetical protein
MKRASLQDADDDTALARGEIGRTAELRDDPPEPGRIYPDVGRV